MITPEQNFYLILVAFYLLSSIRLSSPHSYIIRKNIFKGWSHDRPFSYFAGLEKSLTFSKLHPWGITIITKSKGKPISAKNAKKILNLYLKASSTLRHCSLTCFILFYIALPVFYISPNRTNQQIIIVAILGVCYMCATGIVFFFTHKRLFKHQQEERIKKALILACLPWTAIRAPEELFFNSIKKYHFSSFLAALYQDGITEPFSIYARETNFKNNNTGDKKNLKKVIISSNINEDDLYPIPQKKSAQANKYCPCCLITLNTDSSCCPDCKTIKLKNI